MKNQIITGFNNIVKSRSIGIYLMAFAIPFLSDMLGICIAVIIVEQLIRNPKIDKNHFLAQLSFKNPGIWLLLFYLMHVVGLWQTENMGFANLDLGMKATLGILPVFFLFYKAKIDWNYFIHCFIIGALISFFINLILSLYSYILGDRFIYLFTNENLSHFMHRGYWAVYLSLAYFFLLKILKSGVEEKYLKKYIIASVLIALAIVLSGSKVGMIFVFVLTLWGSSILMKTFDRKKTIKTISILVLSVFLVLQLFVPRIFDRVSDSFKTVLQPIENYDVNNPSSTAARIMVWDSSIDLIKERFWLGFGTGDVKDQLIQKNYDNGYIAVADKKLNSHNQFFNSHIALGVLGSLFLLLTLLTSFIKKAEDPFWSWRCGIILMLFFALLPESMLETQAGIIPYAFLLSILPSFKAVDYTSKL